LYVAGSTFRAWAPVDFLAVPRLILLNGPPGIGKSVLAQLWADDHPGVLDLDIDRLRVLVGGWRERFAETGEIVRPLALGMASAHLRGGRDVVMPQFLGRLSEIERFEAVAHDSGAAFCQIVLMDTKEHTLERFYRRGDNDAAEWHQHVREATVLTSAAGAIGQAYQALTAALKAVA
jgi:predicted kinase